VQFSRVLSARTEKGKRGSPEGKQTGEKAISPGKSKGEKEEEVATRELEVQRGERKLQSCTKKKKIEGGDRGDRGPFALFQKETGDEPNRGGRDEGRKRKQTRIANPGGGVYWGR